MGKASSLPTETPCLFVSQLNPAVVEELKRSIEALPLETNAVTSVAPRLSALDAPAFGMLLKELARDNHAFRHAAAC